VGSTWAVSAFCPQLFLLSALSKLSFFCNVLMSLPSEDQLARALSGVPQAAKAALYEAVLSFTEPGSALTDAADAAEKAGWHKGSSGSVADAELLQRALLGYRPPESPKSFFAARDLRARRAVRTPIPPTSPRNRPGPAEPATPPADTGRSPTSPAEQVKEEAQAALLPAAPMEQDEGEESEEATRISDACTWRANPPARQCRRWRSGRSTPNRASDTDAADTTAPPAQAKDSAPLPAEESTEPTARQVFICSGCDTQMNIWQDRASEYVCSYCGLLEDYQAAVLHYDRPSASGAVGQFSGERRRKAWQCPSCGFMHCTRCARKFMGAGWVPRQDGLTSYTGERRPTRGPPASVRADLARAEREAADRDRETRRRNNKGGGKGRDRDRGGDWSNRRGGHQRP
ncbi:unnamed protein product, partial [Symbiodinium sp. CCMP2456]